MRQVLIGLAGSLATPSMVLILALGLGLALIRLGGTMPGLARLGLLLIGFAGPVLVAAALLPIDGVLLRPLEHRFPLPAADAPAPAGIILLGGVTDGGVEAKIGRPKYRLGGEAIAETARLARRFPTVPIVLTGGGPIEDDGDDFTEAGSMARLLIEAGVAPERLLLERRARTTWDNARLTFEMLRPAPGARWWLVTPAWHMPRSIGAFRAAGWDGIVAAPSPGESGAERLRPPGERLARLDLAAHEWLGLAVYALRGRSPSWFPGP